MPNDTVSDWSTTPASNTEVGGVDLAENSMRPRDVNNAIRTMMAQIATGIDNSEFGGVPQFHPATAAGPATLDFAEDTDNGTNKIVLSAPSSIASDRTVTLPNATGTLPLLESANTFTATQTIAGTSVGFAPVVAQLSEDGAAQGPFVILRRISASAAANDALGYFGFQGSDSAGNQTNVAFMGADWVDPTDGAETGKMSVQIVSAGSIATRAIFQAGLTMQGATGGDKGAGSVNAASSWINGVAISPPGAPVTKTADFTVATTEQYLINNKSGSSCTVTLPTASSFPGRKLTIKTIQAQTTVSASSNVVPLGTAVAGTAILSANAGRWAKLVSDGTNWVIMEGVV